MSMWPQCPDSGAPGGKGDSSFESDWPWILSLKGKEQGPEAATALGLWASRSLKVQPQGPPCQQAGRARSKRPLCPVHAAPRTSGICMVC